MGYEADRHWSEQFLPAIKVLCAPLVLSAAPLEEDKHRNTDLMVLTAEPVRIACRMRRFEAFTRWPHDITIRTAREHGKTELTKILEGWGTYLFYGFADQYDYGIWQWTILDLAAFRLWFVTYMRTHVGQWPGLPHTNHDHSSTFCAFDVRQFPAGVVRLSATPPGVALR